MMTTGKTMQECEGDSAVKVPPMSTFQQPTTYTCYCPNEKNEDRFSEERMQIAGTELTVLGIYDGHGGHYCSEYISQALPAEIAEAFDKYPGKSISAILEKSFVNVDDYITGALQQGFKSSIGWIRTKARKQKAVDDLLEQTTLVDVALRARAGSTALVAVIGPKYIHVANVGDCRAVLGQNSEEFGHLQAVALTRDQDGHNQAECLRVLSEHPVKEHKDIFAGGRLFGETPVTRSFGDSFYKLDDTDYTEYVFGSSKLPRKPGVMPYNMKMKPIYPLIRSAPYLTANPEVTVHERSRLDQFMVIASDGVWALKPVNNDWVVQVVASAITRGEMNPAEALMQEVKGFNPGDDVTIKVVKL